MNSAIFLAAEQFWKSVRKRAPEILTALGIAGMASGTIAAVKVTSKAIKLIEKRKQTEGVEKLTPLQVVETTWKCYVPVVITELTSATCLICAQSINGKRNAAITAAYALSESAFKEYKDKVAETIGEKKEREIRDSIAEDHFNQTAYPFDISELPGEGSCLCLNTLENVYFCVRDWGDIKNGVNEFNRALLYEEKMSLNELYDYWNIPHTKLGEAVGWDIAHGFVNIDEPRYKTLRNGKTIAIITHSNLPYSTYLN